MEYKTQCKTCTIDKKDCRYKKNGNPHFNKDSVCLTDPREKEKKKQEAYDRFKKQFEDEEDEQTIIIWR